MPLEETFQWMEKIGCHLANEIGFLKDFVQQYAEEIGELLSGETISRFKGVAMSLKYPYENFKAYEDSERRHHVEQGFLVQSWSSLGSLLESTLQIFLAIHYRDYVKSEWYKWDRDAIQQISDELSGGFKESLTKLVKENEDGGKPGLTKRILKSFLEKAKGILKDKLEDPRIEKINLSDLINFYFGQGVIQDTEYTQGDLDKIRGYRNAIHAFQKREIGSWEELNKHIKDLILLSIDMLYRLPDIPQEVPLPDWYVENKSSIIMQEHKWFQYKMELTLDETKTTS